MFSTFSHQTLRFIYGKNMVLVHLIVKKTKVRSNLFEKHRISNYSYLLYSKI